MALRSYGPLNINTVDESVSTVMICCAGGADPSERAVLRRGLPCRAAAFPGWTRTGEVGAGGV